MDRLRIQEWLDESDDHSIREFMRLVARSTFEHWVHEPRLRCFVDMAIARYIGAHSPRSHERGIGQASSYFDIPMDTIRSRLARVRTSSAKRTL